LTISPPPIGVVETRLPHRNLPPNARRKRSGETVTLRLRLLEQEQRQP